MEAPLIWLDMEMTGLEPETCVPVEVAIIVTDGELQEKASWSAAIWQPESKLEQMTPFVRQMHTDNGLLEKVRQSQIDVRQAENRMINIIANHAAPKQGVLAGNSVHHDRRFLETYFPTVHSFLHYRLVDVSSVKEIIARWYQGKAKYPKPKSDHTALSDIRASINELRYYRETFFRTVDQVNDPK